MTFRAVVSCVVALLVVFLAASVVMAEVGLPAPIATELTLFPGAKVLNGNSLPGGNHVAMVNFGKASITEVYGYYKAKMIENGFTIETDIQGTSIIASKGNIDAMVDLDTQKGETVGTLSITGGNDGPTAPPAPPTPPASPTPSASSEKPSISMAGPDSQAKYPAEVAAIVKQYPGSMVMTSNRKANGIGVLLTMKGCSLADAVAYYKSALSKGGWEMDGEENVQGGAVLGFKKDKQGFTVIIRDVTEALVVTINLDQ